MTVPTWYYTHIVFSSTRLINTFQVVKIHFPGSKMKDLDLDVCKNRIRAESKDLKLFTYLPRCVDHTKGSAKFDVHKEVLSITLPIVDDEL